MKYSTPGQVLAASVSQMIAIRLQVTTSLAFSQAMHSRSLPATLQSGGWSPETTKNSKVDQSKTLQILLTL